MPRKTQETPPDKPLTLEEVVQALKEIEEMKKVEEGRIPSPLPSAVQHSEFLTARAELYARLVRVVKMGMEKYYKRFPGREGDQRAVEATLWSMAGIKAMILILDDYEISYRPTKDGIEL